MEEYWSEWDTSVDAYITAMTLSRAADRSLKMMHAQTYETMKKSGKGVEDAKQAVYNNQAYIAAWKESDEASIAEKLARLKLDKMQMRFEEWRSRNATRRAEIGLR